jgi:hypothetical protein
MHQFCILLHYIPQATHAAFTAWHCHRMAGKCPRSPFLSSLPSEGLLPEPSQSACRPVCPCQCSAPEYLCRPEAHGLHVITNKKLRCDTCTCYEHHSNYVYWLRQAPSWYFAHIAKMNSLLCKQHRGGPCAGAPGVDWSYLLANGKLPRVFLLTSFGPKFSESGLISASAIPGARYRGAASSCAAAKEAAMCAPIPARRA